MQLLCWLLHASSARLTSGMQTVFLLSFWCYFFFEKTSPSVQFPARKSAQTDLVQSTVARKLGSHGAGAFGGLETMGLLVVWVDTEGVSASRVCADHLEKCVIALCVKSRLQNLTSEGTPF